MRGSACVSETVVIEERFHGPPRSANGGYTCGVLARLLDADGAVEATLRAPPPLGHSLGVVRSGDAVELRDGEALVAEARPTDDPEIDLPAAISIEQATEARRDAPTEDHPFPTCFVCGPARAPGDGLNVVCGPVPGRERELIGSVFDSAAWSADRGGAVPPEIVWGVLDCPSGIAGTVVPVEGLYVLGRLTARIERPLKTGPSYAVIGWPITEEGRKFDGGSAILDADGDPLAWARSTWIRIKETA